MNIDSYLPVKIVSGKGAAEKAAGEISKLGKRCLIMTGGSSASKSGALVDAERILNENGILYSVFDKTEQNPLTSTCKEAGKHAYKFGADFLMGIGGGSPLDAVKAAAFFAANPNLEPDEIYSDRSLLAPPLPTVLIGTTAGTGSEVTGVSVLTDSTGKKKSISGADCYGRIAVCDYTYTLSLPYSVTVSTALDAFAHETESFLSLKANTISEMYALKGLELTYCGLDLLCKTKALPDEALREQLYYGSIFAGLAINITGTLFPHTLGYYLTEKRNIPHGRACTAFTPAVFDRYEKYAPEKLKTIENLLGRDKREILETVKILTNVKESISYEEAKQTAESRTGTVNNFVRTPAGFTPEDEINAMLSLR